MATAPEIFQRRREVRRFAGVIPAMMPAVSGNGPGSNAFAEPPLAGLGDAPDGSVRLDEATILEGVQHRLVEDEVPGLFFDAFQRDPFGIRENRGMSDLEVLNVHERLLLVECPCSAVSRMQS
jgi:hypothetical protein